MFDIEIKLIQTDVTCIKLSQDKVLAGIGDQLHIFDKLNNRLQKKIKIFDGQKIYGIVHNSAFSQCLIYGGREIKIFNLQNSLRFIENLSYTCQDWILEAKWIDQNENIATISMHNIVILWTKEMKFIKKIICEEKCILYSAHLVNNTWNDLIVLSGTVFSQILIWWPQQSLNELCPVLCKLNGHKGVIFSVDYNAEAGLICSTSDDRHTILWSVPSNNLILELSKPDVQINKTYSLYGHTARVFKSMILNKYVLTAGEDSIINIWNLQGQLIRKIDAHQGAPVWSFDSSERDNIIVSGGGDSGITIFSLKPNINKQILQMDEHPKRVVILQDKSLVTISEKGLIEYYSESNKKKVRIARHDNLISYTLLEISPCRRLIALAGYQGEIYIYKQADETLKLLAFFQLKGKLRIFSFHWLSSFSYLICTTEGMISLWDLTQKELVTCRRKFILPPSKERWTTAACIVHNKYIAVGDRKGNIYLYSEDMVDPLQIIKKAHNYLGITYLCTIGNKLFSIGRNSTLKRYWFDESQKQLLLLSSDKLPFTWLARLYQTDQALLLLSFLNDEFVIWDYNYRRILLQTSCGGGHRSWDFYNNDGTIFCYIKDKSVQLIQFQWDLLYPIDLIKGYHINEINGACLVKDLKNVNNPFFISGGEDTTLRISQINLENNSFKTHSVLKSHLSNIRAVTAVKISNGEDHEKYLVVSAGGRAQIILWQLHITHLDNQEIVSCSEKYSYHEPCMDDSENRIMDLGLIHKSDTVIVIAGCSDGTLQVLLIHMSNSNYKMLRLKTLNYKLKCILKVAYINILNYDIILSMATDGVIAFWDFTTFMETVNNKCETIINSDLLDIEINQFFSIKTHQSGINSFMFKIINNNQCIFVSGGDDNAVVVNIVEFAKEEGLIVKVLFTHSHISSHCAQITGVSFFNNYFCTTSIDQRLNIFEWKIVNNVLLCNLTQTYNLVIADIHGMECFEGTYVIVYGKGIQACKITNKAIKEKL